MIPLLNLQSVSRLLCIGAHPDDIEIGAGGTILRLVRENPGVQIHWLVICGAEANRAEEARQSAELFTSGAAKVEINIHKYEDAFLPWQGAELKQLFEQLKTSVSPDLILTHCESDRHQDHRLLSELTWNTWRDHQIFEYEIMKWDGDLGRPGTFVALDDALAQQKVQDVYASFPSQHNKSWFRQDKLLALMKIRGVECNSEFAEAFHTRKLVW